MLKKSLFTLLLVFSLTILLPVAVFVIAPDKVIHSIGNRVLADYAIKIESLEGFELVFSALKPEKIEIRNIDLVFTEDQSNFSIEGVEIDLSLRSLFSPVVNRVFLQKVEITLPKSENQIEPAPLKIGQPDELREIIEKFFADNYSENLLSDILDTMNTSITEEMEIVDLSVDSYLNNVHFTSNLSSSGFSITLKENHLSLTLNSSWPASNKLLTNIKMSEHDEIIASLDSVLSFEKDSLKLQTSGEIETEKLVKLVSEKIKALSARTALSETTALSEDTALSDINPEGKLIYQTDFSLTESSLVYSMDIKEDTDLLLDLSYLIGEKTTVSLSSPIQLNGEIQFKTEETTFFIAQADVPFSSFLESEPYQGEVHFRLLEGQCSLAFNCSLSSHLGLAVDTLNLDEAELKNISADFAIDLSLTNDQLTLVSPAGGSVVVNSAISPTAELSDLTAELLSNLSLEINLTNNDLVVNIEKMSIDLPMIEFDGEISSMSLETSQLALIQTEETQLNLQYSILHLKAELSDLAPLSPEARGSLQLNNQKIELIATIAAAQRDLLNVNVHHDIEKQTGYSTIVFPELSFDSTSNKLSSYFQTWPFEFDLVGGTISASSQLNWHWDEQWKISGPAQLSINELGGFYGELLFFADLRTDITGEVLPSLDFRSHKALSGSIGTFDAGVPVNNIDFVYEIDSEQKKIELNHLSAGLLNGELEINDFTYDPNTSAQSITIELAGIDLSEIAALVEYPGEMMGLISGSLPILVDENGLTMDKGALDSGEKGGIIRYDPGIANQATQNSSLQIVNEALSNYHFDSLKALASYNIDGDLLLEVKLTGENPDMNEGQKINLNVNISDNIPTLLRSLQAGRSIADSLEQLLDL